MVLRKLTRWPGRHTKAHLNAIYPSITDNRLEDRIQSHLYTGYIKKAERIFPMCREAVNRHIHTLAERVGRAPFVISAHTFRHAFANHLLTMDGGIFIKRLLSTQSGH